MPSTRASLEKRATSAPETKAPDHLGFLPVITEEGDQRSSRDGVGSRQRSVTAPVQKEKRSQDKTIRIVPPSPSGTVAPLNVRKRSNGNETSSSGSQNLLSVKTSNEHLCNRRANNTVGGLAVIDEDSTLQSAQNETSNVVRKKRSGWFGLRKKTLDQEVRQDGSSTPEPFRELDDRRERRPTMLNKPSAEKLLPPDPPVSAQSNESSGRKRRFGVAEIGLSRLLGKIGSEKEDGEEQRGEFASHTAAVSTALTYRRKWNTGERFIGFVVFVSLAGAF